MEPSHWTFSTCATCLSSIHASGTEHISLPSPLDRDPNENEQIRPHLLELATALVASVEELLAISRFLLWYRWKIWCLCHLQSISATQNSEQSHHPRIDFVDETLITHSWLQSKISHKRALNDVYLIVKHRQNDKKTADTARPRKNLKTEQHGNNQAIVCNNFDVVKCLDWVGYPACCKPHEGKKWKQSERLFRPTELFNWAINASIRSSYRAALRKLW